MTDGTTRSVTTEKYKKGSYGNFDVLAAAGLTSEDDMVNVSSITFQQNDANGGARIYDMFIRVPDNNTSISDSAFPSAKNVVKYCRNGRIVIVRNGICYNAQGQVMK